MLRIGGLVVGVTVIVSMLLHPTLIIDQAWFVFIVVIGSALLYGLYDDVRPQSWRSQIAVQVLLAGIIVAAGFRIEYSFLTGLVSGAVQSLLLAGLTALWVLVIVNAYNWCDGVDGLAGGIGVIAFGALFIVALSDHVYQPPLAIVAVIMMGALFVFTCFNVFGRSMMLGTSGSYIIGFMLAFMAIFAGGKVGTMLAVLLIPLCDFVYVIWQRLREGVNIFRADERHLHYHLLRSGWTKERVVTVYLGVTVLGATAAAFFQGAYKFFFLAFYAVFIFSVLSFSTYLSKNKNESIS